MIRSFPRVPISSHFLTLLRPWLTLALVSALFSFYPIFRNTFWTANYLPNVMQQSARTVVLAVGMSFVILTGGIDLSVGAVLALSGVGIAMALSGTLPLWMAFVVALPFAALAAWLAAGRLQEASAEARLGVAGGVLLLTEAVLGFAVSKGLAGGVKMEGAILVGLLVGVACGLVNGVIVSVGRVPSFVMTLGMMSAARGLTLYATDGNSVRASVPRFMTLGQGTPLVLITLAVVGLGALLLTRTRAGRCLLAIGGNETAARLTGVPVSVYKTLAFVLSGLGAAIGAILVTAKFGLADTNAGTGAELDAIAAVVIGGTSLRGGQGSIVGALVGALTITVIEAGLVLVGIKDTLQPVILGGVIVLTVYVDQARRKQG
jgi:ribose/xylose/arabinose/galactoside ABC-type transport system permease subunit